MEETRIKEIRLRLGLSQERFARRLGVALQTVRRWESGLTKPLPIISLRIDELEGEAAARQGWEGRMAMKRKTGSGTVGVEVGLGGLFKGIGNLLDLVSQMAERGQEEASATGEVEGLGGKMRGVYGISVHMGLGGKPVIEQFGNVRQGAAGPVVGETREPLVDVLDEGDSLSVIVELPAIAEQDIRLHVEGDVLEVSAATGDRKYYKAILLPSAVAGERVASSYRNGVLEIKLPKRGLPRE